MCVSTAGAEDQGGLAAQERRVSWVCAWSLFYIVYIEELSCRENIEWFIKLLEFQLHHKFFIYTFIVAE